MTNAGKIETNFVETYFGSESSLSYTVRAAPWGPALGSGGDIIVNSTYAHCLQVRCA